MCCLVMQLLVVLYDLVSYPVYLAGGQEPARQSITIYVVMRAEWLLSAYSAFSKIVVSTIYTNLENNAMARSMNETEVSSLVVTNHELFEGYEDRNVGYGGREIIFVKGMSAVDSLQGEKLIECFNIIFVKKN